jgi:hypothetical protein
MYNILKGLITSFNKHIWSLNFQEFFGMLSARAHATFSCLLPFRFAVSNKQSSGLTVFTSSVDFHTLQHPCSRKGLTVKNKANKKSNSYLDSRVGSFSQTCAACFIL